MFYRLTTEIEPNGPGGYSHGDIVDAFLVVPSVVAVSVDTRTAASASSPTYVITYASETAHEEYMSDPTLIHLANLIGGQNVEELLETSAVSQEVR